MSETIWNIDINIIIIIYIISLCLEHMCLDQRSQLFPFRFQLRCCIFNKMILVIMYFWKNFLGNDKMKIITVYILFLVLFNEKWNIHFFNRIVASIHSVISEIQFLHKHPFLFPKKNDILKFLFYRPYIVTWY